MANRPVATSTLPPKLVKSITAPLNTINDNIAPATKPTNPPAQNMSVGSSRANHAPLVSMPPAAPPSRLTPQLIRGKAKKAKTVSLLISIIRIF